MRRHFLATACIAGALAVMSATPAVAQVNAGEQLDSDLKACLTGADAQTDITAPSGLLVVGDGLAASIDDATGTTTAFGGPLTFLTQPGATVAKMATRTDSVWPQWREELTTRPGRVLVAFGADRVITEGDVEAVMALVGPTRNVYWWGPLHKETAANAPTLIAAATRHPNLTYIPAAKHLPDGGALREGPVAAPAPARTVQAAWRETIATARTQFTPATNTSPACADALRSLDGGASMRREALDFAVAVVSDPASRYTLSTTTNPGTYPYPFNCSTLVAAAYRVATDEAMQLIGFSDSLLWDEVNIELVPWSQAQPGDIFFQKTMSDRFLGHVGMILTKDDDGYGGTVIHACGDDSWCADAPAQGMGYTDITRLAASGALITATNPATVNTYRRGSVGFTSNHTQAWYGRVIQP